jgi:hypothetical protein
MDRSEFTSLPPAIALGILYDLLVELSGIDAPSVPRSPKFDGKLPRQGGFVWMSEVDLETLEWWYEKKAESAAGGGQYAEKDAKLVPVLAKWLEWRRVFPFTQWSGTRGDDRAIATFPCKNPKLREWGPRPAGGPKGSGKTTGSTPKPPAKTPESGGDDDFDF